MKHTMALGLLVAAALAAAPVLPQAEKSKSQKCPSRSVTPLRNSPSSARVENREAQ